MTGLQGLAGWAQITPSPPQRIKPFPPFSVASTARSERFSWRRGRPPGPRLIAAPAGLAGPAAGGGSPGGSEDGWVTRAAWQKAGRRPLHPCSHPSQRAVRRREGLPEEARPRSYGATPGAGSAGSSSDDKLASYMTRAATRKGQGEYVGVDEKVGLGRGALDQFDAAVAPLFDRQLEQMGLSESQVEQQDLAQLETTLEKVNHAIDNSGSLMKFRVRLTAEAGAVITQGPDYHYEVSILPVLVTRKGRVLERIKALRPSPGSGPAPASGTPAGSQEIRGSRDAFASRRDFTIINYFGTGQGTLTGAGEATADADSERNEPGAHPWSDFVAAQDPQPGAGHPETRSGCFGGKGERRGRPRYG